MSWTGEQFVGDLTAAIQRFHVLLPGWWFSVGLCHVSADATVAPDSAGSDYDLLKMKFFDQGFSADILPPATMASSLTHATIMGMVARDAFRERGTEEAAKAAVEALGIQYEPRSPFTDTRLRIPADGR